MRLLIYERELRRLLLDARDHDYLVIRDSRDDECYVHYLVHESALYGEVGSRAWVAKSQGVRKESETALGCLGFEGAGSCRKFSRDHLPHDPRRLACLTELLFGAAYGDVEDMTPLVMTRASREADCNTPAIGLDA